MRLPWIIFASALFFAAVLTRAADEAAAEAADSPDGGLGAYKTILERMPFGPEPPNFNPDAAPGSAAAAAAAAVPDEAVRTEEEQQIVSSVRVSVLNVTPSGIVAVGFTDSAVQPPANYYMKVGETRDVWEVKSADPAEQTVTLSKNGVEVELKVGEAAGGKGAKSSGRPETLARFRGGAPRPGGEDAAQGGLASARERLRARRQRSMEELKAEDARREAAAAEARKDAARAAAEREQQREALLQIQEELRRQREERAAREAEEKQQQESES